MSPFTRICLVFIWLMGSVFASAIAVAQSNETSLFESAVEAERSVKASEASESAYVDFESSLYELAVMCPPPYEAPRNEQERFARRIVARTSTDSSPSIVCSFAPVLLDVFPGSTTPLDGATDEISGSLAKYILFRCLSDDAFASQYLNMLLWSGRFVREPDESDQRYELSLVMKHLRSPEATGGNLHWHSSLKLFILTELFTYRKDEPFPTTQEDVAKWANAMDDWVMSHRFELTPDGNRWQATGARISVSPGIDLVPMKLPQMPLPGIFECSFESLKKWARQP